MNSIFFYYSETFNKTRNGTIDLIEKIRHDVDVSISELMMKLSNEYEKIQETLFKAINDIKNETEEIRIDMDDKIEQVRNEVRISI